MDVNSILLFAITEMLLSMTPGPAIFLVISQGIRSGYRASIVGSLGILTGNAIYFAISALGIGAIIATSQTFFFVVKWAGAVYLVYLGGKMIYQSFLITEETDEVIKPTSGKMLFRQGLTLQLANPQAILFFVAILPQFLDPASSSVQQLLILGFVSVFVEFPVLLVYGGLAAKGGAILKKSRLFKWLDRVAGMLLVGAGLKLGLSGQS